MTVSTATEATRLVPIKMGGAGHSPFKIALVISCAVCFAVVVAFNSLAASVGQQLGIFKSNTGNISNTYNLAITPSGATFSVWSLIYIWQGVWIVYSLTLLCRKYGGGLLYIDPPVIPLSVYVVYIINQALNITWLFLWDNEIMPAACVFLFLIAISLYIILFISIRDIDSTARLLHTGGNNCDKWFVRLFLQNGIAIYAGWTTVASLINLGVCLVYNAGLSQTTACSVCLGILTAEIVAFFVVENFVLERHFRYISAQYITVMAGVIGSYVKNKNTAPQTISTWITVLMVIVIVLFAFKLIKSFIMHFKRPINYSDSMMSEVRLANSRQVLSST